VHVAIDVLGLMRIASLSTMLWRNIDGLDLVLLAPTTGV
jgi:hypothetical protein